ncbi:hypothetical protein [Sandarakinorhabdus sp.]|jgi:hypothetical protein|uniref:hypothetical protein n=1 Tax=Sandarakinorhabdus sp. TaxID=1916663 RepID=UPI0028AB613A|nr:hypothetical protein [Sandarakinorhabdus sp.]
MKRNLGIIAGLLVLAACGEKGGADTVKAGGAAAAPPIVPAESLVAGATEEIPTAKCSGDPIGKPVVMILGDKSISQLGGNDQEIVRNVTRDGKGSGPPTLANPKLYPTNLDLAANGVASKQGDYVEIKIQLQPAKPANRDMIFIRMDASAVPKDGDSSAGAVTVRKGDSGLFCGRSPITKNQTTGYETVTFGSLLQPGMESSLNIGVLVANKKDPTKWTPIYIDPNMKNEG